MLDEVFQWRQGTQPPRNELFLNLIGKTAHNICPWDSRKIILTGADAEKGWYLQLLLNYEQGSGWLHHGT